MGGEIVRQVGGEIVRQVGGEIVRQAAVDCRPHVATEEASSVGTIYCQAWMEPIQNHGYHLELSCLPQLYEAHQRTPGTVRPPHDQHATAPEGVHPSRNANTAHGTACINP